VVLAATVPDHFEAVADGLARIADTVTLALAGAGVRADLADRVGALALSEDPVTVATGWARSP
jgi:hypothetical protein